MGEVNSSMYQCTYQDDHMEVHLEEAFHHHSPPTHCQDYQNQHLYIQEHPKEDNSILLLVCL